MLNDARLLHVEQYSLSKAAKHLGAQYALRSIASAISAKVSSCSTDKAA
jgi:hypothetical protein